MKKNWNIDNLQKSTCKINILQSIKIILLTLLLTTIASIAEECHYFDQGTVTCISTDNPAPVPEPWLPTECPEGERLLQGTTNICLLAETVVAAPLHPRKNCNKDQQLVQGTNTCNYIFHIARTRENITKLFISMFNRAPGEEELNYWYSSGLTIEEMLRELFNSSEAQMIYPSGSSTRNFVEVVYNNIFDHALDPGELEYWIDEIDSDHFDRSTLVQYAISFNQQDDALILANKVEVALAFSTYLGAWSNILDTVNLGSDRAYQASVRILSGVTAGPETVTRALDFLESIKGNDDPLSDILNGLKMNAFAILSLVTEMEDANLSNVLSPNKKSTLRLIGLEASAIKLTVTSARGIHEILPTFVSMEAQYITFTSPVNVIDGKLSIIDSLGNVLNTITYETVTSQTPYIKELLPDIVNVGDSVTIEGVNLPATPMQIVFEGQDSNLTQTVTPTGNSISFTVPQDASSGRIYLQISQVETNRLQLTIKRSIDVKVVLADGIDIDASDISFAWGGIDHKLEQNL